MFVATDSLPFRMLNAAAGFLPMLTYAGIVIGGVYGLYKFRSPITASIVAILSRLTKGKRR